MKTLHEILNAYRSDVPTRCENGKTIRTWTESRSGGKALTREFYIRFQINATLNGKTGHATYDTYEQAVTRMLEWQGNISKMYGIEWVENDHTPLTHTNGSYFFGQSAGRGKNIQRANVYITEQASGTISETIN